MKVINGRNILEDGTIDLSNTARFISLEEFNSKYSHFAVEDGDIVVTTSGTIGKVGRIKHHHLPIMMNTSVIRFHPLPSAPLDADYLFSFLRSSLFQNQAMNLAIGAAQPNFGPAHLKQMQMPLPPLPIQRKIAAILSAYDDLIENNMRQINTLEEIAQLIYREWFVNFRFPGHEKAKMIESTLGRIPQGWRVGKISELATIKSGYAFKSGDFVKGGHYGLVTIKNVHYGQFIPSCQSHIQEIPANTPEYCRLQTGDILLSLTGNIGRTCLVYGDDFLLNQRVAKIVPAKATFCGYVYFFFRQREFQKRLEALATGVAQQNLSPVQTSEMEVLLPSNALIESFANYSEVIVKEILVLYRQNATLRCTRDLLLPKLISGELDVSELDIGIGEEPE